MKEKTFNSNRGTEEKIRQMESKIQKLENELTRFSTIIGTALDPIICTNLEGNITYWNKGAENLYGYTEQEMLSKPVSIIYKAKDIPVLEAMIAELLEVGEILNKELRVIDKYKNEKIILLSLTIQKDNTGKIVELVGYTKDITAIKTAENTIKESEEKFRNLMEQSPFAIQIHDPDGTLVQSNKALAKLYGFSPETHAGLNGTYNMLHDKQAENLGLIPYIEKLLAGESVNFPEYAYHGEETISKLGLDMPIPKKRWIKGAGYPIKDKDGKITSVVYMGEDITERKQAEQKLKESDELTRALLDATHDAVHLLDENGIIIELNQAMEEMLGRPREVLIGTCVFDLFPEEMAGRRKEIINKAISEKKALQVEDIGMKGIYESNIYPIPTPKNNKQRVALFARNITKRKNAEQKIIESEAILSALLENSLDLIAYRDLKGCLVTFNQAFAKLVWDVFEIEAVPGLRTMDTQGKAFKEHWEGILENVIKGEPHHDEFSWVSKAGETQYFDISIRRIVKNGEVIGTAEFTRDITERKQAELELRKAKEKAEENEKRFEDITFSMDDWVWEVDEKGVYTYSSEVGSAFFGLSRVEIIGKSPFDFMPPDEAERVGSIFTELVADKLPIKNVENWNIDKNGELILLLTNALPIFGATGNFRGYRGVDRDITEQKKFTETLVEARDKAEESDRLKSAFLANMSHEIRTPMNGILGFSSLLSEPGLESEEQQAYIKVIQKSGARMLNILSEIVEISKIESGAIDLQIQQLNINKKMESVYELLKPDATAKTINLSLQNNLHLTEPILNTDEGKLDSILTNLIKNAIKYTDKGFVEFGYNPKKIDGRNFLEFYVKDTGIGIRGSRLDAIFERFIQADIEDVQARQGAGLGLTIVKSYVELLGGRVWVESEIEIGSIFYFTLPDNSESREEIVNQNSSASEKFHNQINSEFSKLKILIAEDDNTSVIYLSTIIKDIASTVLVANSGVEAVTICRSNTDINLVLMDIQMPEMNGYEATQQIREFNKEVIIIAQTAFVMAGDKEKSIEAGCNDYISKPIKKDNLMALIQKYFTK